MLSVSAPDQSMVALMLMLLLGSVILVGTFLAILTAHWLRTRKSSFLLGSFPSAAYPRETSERTLSELFERPVRWLTIRHQNVAAVQRALGLHKAALCGWTEAIAHLGDRRLFISPPIKGWILVVGQSLPDPADDPDRCFHFITRLSRELGRVQYFSYNRAVNHHCWVKADAGVIHRAYAWAGETVWNQGELTSAERNLGLKCYDYGESPLVFPFTARESHFANGDKVVLLASQWSIDPMGMAHLPLLSHPGITGEISAKSRGFPG
ncbi:MAG: hypothetical protein SFY81_13870 [Verrucomicrobiota bacterium]|nr:hypothetical protein [Verrucomicrobiota bacterium]